MNVCVWLADFYGVQLSDCVRKIMNVCVFGLQIFVEFNSVIDCQKDHECMCVWFADLSGVQLSD